VGEWNSGYFRVENVEWVSGKVDSAVVRMVSG
jgi:hypothetical protein